MSREGEDDDETDLLVFGAEMENYKQDSAGVRAADVHQILGVALRLREFHHIHALAGIPIGFLLILTEG